MTERLNPLGVNYSFIEAVNGSALDLKTLPVYDGARRRMLFGRDMSKGELGCLLSHRAIYQKIVDEKIAVQSGREAKLTGCHELQKALERFEAEIIDRAKYGGL